MKKKYILITGAAGYIGSHTLIEFLKANYNVISLDSYINSSRTVLEKVTLISGREFVSVDGDIGDISILEKLFSTYTISLVVHLAAFKSVEESVTDPLIYFNNNITGTLSLLRIMKKYDVFRFIFSSSATVYGRQVSNPISENTILAQVTNPYGYSKKTVEEMLIQLHRSDPRWSIASLRYFNPIGAHESGLIGEDPRGLPSNLLPYIQQVAIGKLDYLRIYGSDYPTIDGTGVRDYLHVMDLADGHVCVAKHMLSNDPYYNVWNLGTGCGYSVLQVVNAFEKVNNVPVPYKIGDRRAGDLPEVWADVKKIHSDLGWKAKYTLSDMLKSAWGWQTKNPNGYADVAKTTVIN
jgi:UDP-glucose 4-epimerase